MNSQRNNNSQPKRNQARRKRQRQRKKASNPRTLQVTNIKKMMLRVGNCTRYYARAVINPFAYLAEPPCIPDSISMPSNKYTTTCRGVLSTGVQGTGFILVSPFLMSASGLDSNVSGLDQPVIYTNTSYDQPGLRYNNSSTFVVGTEAANSNSPYNYTNFFDDNVRQFRVVGCGVKLRYVGSTFRNQGRVCSFRSPGNVSIPSGTVVPMSTLLKDNANQVFPVTRAHQYVNYVPDSHYFLGYQTFDSYMPSAGGNSHRAIGFLIEGADASVPQSWEFEVIAHFEAIGPNFTYTPSHSDAQGFGGVLSSLPETVPTRGGDAEENSLWQRFSQYFDNESTRYVMDRATDVVKIGAGAFANQATRSILNSSAQAIGNSLGGRLML